MSISSTASTSTTTFYPTSNRTSIDTTATSINNDYANTNKPTRLSTTSSLFTIDSELNDLYPELPSNFKLIELLGEGAFSSVYKAIDISKNNMIVAIKIIDKINLNLKQLQNIINEINILKQINYHHHPNIIELLGVIDGINQTFLILEYCDGGEIFDQILKYTYLSEPLSYHVFKQILNALQYLHNTLNIVHRDLKPENLLFNKIPFFKRGINDNNLEKYLRKSDDINEKIDEGEFKYGIGGGTIGVIKLADFGLAKQLNDKNIAQTPCGTTGYTAPEVFQCRNNNNNNNNNNSNNSNKSSGGSGSGSSSGSIYHQLFKSSKSKVKTKSKQLSITNYSKSVDIWSLGCVLYTLLCGFPPFYNDDIEILTNNVINGKFEFLKPWWDEISNDAKDLVSKMLIIDPNERITIDEIWNHPWILKHMNNESKQRQQKQEEEEEEVPGYFPNHNKNTNIIKQTIFENVHEDIINPINKEKEEEDDDYSLSLVPPPPSQQILSKSPRAIAIKKVFDNPAMTTNKSIKNKASICHGDNNDDDIYFANQEEEKEPLSFFIEDIAELDEEDEEIESEVTNDSDDSDSDSDEDVNVNVNEINEHLKIMGDLPFKTRKNHHDYIKTPYPKLISFKDVFNLNKINSPQEDNEEEEEEDLKNQFHRFKLSSQNLNSLNKSNGIDNLHKNSINNNDSDDTTSTTTTNSSILLNTPTYTTTNNNNNNNNNNIDNYGRSPLRTSNNDNQLIDNHDEHDDTTTTNIPNHETRSSSIISGLNGDFKFTLNLTNSNLLTRRKNSNNIISPITSSSSSSSSSTTSSSIIINPIKSIKPTTSNIGDATTTIINTNATATII